MKVAEMQVTLVDHMGSDLSVVNAARVSFDKESDWVNWNEEYNIPHPDGLHCVKNPNFVGELTDKDKKLISYLAKHNHFTPFTHCSATFRIKVPIFVARQIHKHQVGFTVNEVSRRYVDSPPEVYIPDFLRARAENKKQGSSEDAIYEAVSMRNLLEAATDNALFAYETLLSEGVAPEQARMVLPQNTMTEFWMTGSLFGWARMCNLRLDSHTQKETQEVAKMIDAVMSELYPVSWKELVHVG